MTWRFKILMVRHPGFWCNRLAGRCGNWALALVSCLFVAGCDPVPSTPPVQMPTRRYFPNSDYGLTIFGDGQKMMVGINGRF